MPHQTHINSFSFIFLGSLHIEAHHAIFFYSMFFFFTFPVEGKKNKESKVDGHKIDNNGKGKCIENSHTERIQLSKSNNIYFSHLGAMSRARYCYYFYYYVDSCVRSSILIDGPMCKPNDMHSRVSVVRIIFFFMF